MLLQIFCEYVFLHTVIGNKVMNAVCTHFETHYETPSGDVHHHPSFKKSMTFSVFLAPLCDHRRDTEMFTAVSDKSVHGEVKTPLGLFIYVTTKLAITTFLFSNRESEMFSAIKHKPACS